MIRVSALTTHLIYSTKLNFKSFWDLLIIHHSVRSFNRNADELLLYLHQLRTNIDVTVLTETWFSISYIAKIPRYIDDPSFKSAKRGGEGGCSLFKMFFKKLRNK